MLRQHTNKDDPRPSARRTCRTIFNSVGWIDRAAAPLRLPVLRVASFQLVLGADSGRALASLSVMHRLIAADRGGLDREVELSVVTVSNQFMSNPSPVTDNNSDQL